MFFAVYLPILRPGEFAAPVECSGLFRFGLQLDPTLVSLIDPAGTSSISNLINPVNILFVVTRKNAFSYTVIFVSGDKTH